MKSSIEVIILSVWLVSLVSFAQAAEPWREEAVEAFQTWLKAPDRETYQKLLLNRMLTVMDTRFDPCDDFYSYACGNYDQVIPKNYVSSEQMTPIEETVVPQGPIMERFIRAESNTNSTVEERKMREFYLACMTGQNSTITDRDVLQGFQSWPVYDPNWSETGFDWIKANAHASMFEAPILFVSSISNANNDQNEAELLALTLNLTKFFIEEVEQPEEAHVAMLKIILSNSPVSSDYIEEMVKRILGLKEGLRLIVQNALRTVSMELIGSPIHELQKHMPSCDLPRLVASYTGREVDLNAQLIVPSEEYMENVCKLLGESDKRAVAELMWYYTTIAVLGERENYNEKSQKDLDKYCVEKTQLLFKPVVMRLYRREYLTDEERREFLKFAESLKHVGSELIASSTKWLDNTTRERARQKMEAVEIIIDHPEALGEPWKAYADIEIDPKDFMGNLRRVKAQDFSDTYVVHGQSRVYYPLDPFAVSPRFFGRGKGVLYFPAISLQPPVHHKFTPSFQKYGAVGNAGGHELMHNFDVDGIKYDEHGQKATWISSNIDQLYASRSDCFAKKFDEFILNGTDIHVRGEKTLGENVADADGIKIGLEAFKRWMTENPEQILEEQRMFAPLKMSHEKAFFFSFAQMWCDKRSFEKLKEQVENDAHAPAMFRVPGTLSNLEDFAKAFDCPVGSKMNPTKKCSYIFD